MKAKLTFLGGPETGDVGRCIWGDYEFELNKPIEVTDDHIISKAKNNKFFKVQMLDDGNGTPAPEPEDEDDDDADEETKAHAKALPPKPTTSATRPPSRSR